jgi:DNA repair photolyase
MSPERMLCASAQACRFGCLYCFAKFDRFASNNPLPKFADDEIGDGEIVYPTCDGEFFQDSRAVSKLENLVHSTRTPIRVSISVKSPIGKRQARFLSELNDHLASVDRGFIKCSISLSTKHWIHVYEPKTPDYSHRLQALRALVDEGVPTSVNLRPILPFISQAEYREIVVETAPYTATYLVGGLYIDTTSEFGKQVKLNFPSLVANRPVDWLPGRPSWEYCENPIQLEAIRQSIVENGRQAFDSDVPVIDYLWAEFRAARTAVSNPPL